MGGGGAQNPHSTVFGGICASCGAGAYKELQRDRKCTGCGAAAYSSKSAAKSRPRVCRATQANTQQGSVGDTCSVNSAPPAASSTLSDCRCKSGHAGPDGGTCTACVAGKYKVTIGYAQCTGCVAGTCTACVAGKYKVAIGYAQCTGCMAGTCSTTVRATLNVCQQCPADSNAPEASDDHTSVFY